MEDDLIDRLRSQDNDINQAALAELDEIISNDDSAFSFCQQLGVDIQNLPYNRQTLRLIVILTVTKGLILKEANELLIKNLIEFITELMFNLKYELRSHLLEALRRISSKYGPLFIDELDSYYTNAQQFSNIDDFATFLIMFCNVFLDNNAFRFFDETQKVVFIDFSINMISSILPNIGTTLTTSSVDFIETATHVLQYLINRSGDYIFRHPEVCVLFNFIIDFMNEYYSTYSRNIVHILCDIKLILISIGKLENINAFKKELAVFFLENICPKLAESCLQIVTNSKDNDVIAECISIINKLVKCDVGVDEFISSEFFQALYPALQLEQIDLEAFNDSPAQYLSIALVIDDDDENKRDSLPRSNCMDLINKTISNISLEGLIEYIQADTDVDLELEYKFFLLNCIDRDKIDDSVYEELFDIVGSIESNYSQASCMACLYRYEGNPEQTASLALEVLEGDTPPVLRILAILLLHVSIGEIDPGKLDFGSIIETSLEISALDRKVFLDFFKFLFETFPEQMKEFEEAIIIPIFTNILQNYSDDEYETKKYLEYVYSILECIQNVDIFNAIGELIEEPISTLISQEEIDVNLWLLIKIASIVAKNSDDHIESLFGMILNYSNRDDCILDLEAICSFLVSLIDKVEIENIVGCCFTLRSHFTDPEMHYEIFMVFSSILLSDKNIGFSVIDLCLECMNEELRDKGTIGLLVLSSIAILKGMQGTEALIDIFSGKSYTAVGVDKRIRSLLAYANIQFATENIFAFVAGMQLLVNRRFDNLDDDDYNWDLILWNPLELPDYYEESKQKYKEIWTNSNLNELIKDEDIKTKINECFST